MNVNKTAAKSKCALKLPAANREETTILKVGKYPIRSLTLLHAAVNALSLEFIAVMTLLMLCGSTAIAAEKTSCTDASVREMPGKWKPGLERDVDIEQSSLIPKAEWSAVKQRTEVYADLLHQALGDMKGYSATPYRSVGGAIYTGGPAMYRMQAPLFRYECNNGVLDHEHEYSDEVAIHANGVWAMAGPEARFVINGKHYYQLGSPIGEIRGFPVFETDFRGMNHTHTWVVLVSRPGEAPFRYATRKELLDHLLAENEALRVKALATADAVNPIRPQAVQDREREKDLALFLKGAKDEQQRQHWTERFNKDYRTDEQKRDEARRKMTVVYDKNRAWFEKIAARYTPEQLQQTALAGSIYPDTSFDFKPSKQEVCGKAECGEYHGKPFAIPNAKYFNGTLPRSAPQFFTVSIDWSPAFDKNRKKFDDPRMEKMRDDFFARFDFDRLVSLLGK